MVKDVVNFRCFTVILGSNIGRQLRLLGSNIGSSLYRFKSVVHIQTGGCVKRFLYVG